MSHASPSYRPIPSVAHVNRFTCQGSALRRAVARILPAARRQRAAALAAVRAGAIEAGCGWLRATLAAAGAEKLSDLPTADLAALA